MSEEHVVRRALVTGGAGFLGTHLCGRLLAEGYEVACLDNFYTGRESNLAALRESDRFRLLHNDVVLPFGGEFDEIYNLACPASPPHYQRDPVRTLWTSIAGIHNCLEYAARTGAKVLHASTSEIYGDPAVHPQVEGYWGNVNTIGIRSCYDEGKRVAETMAADYRRFRGVDVRMVRIFNTYGPYMDPADGRVVSNFIVHALSGKPITIYGDGSQTRSFQYCDDLIEAMRRFMSKTRDEVDDFFVGKKVPFEVDGEKKEVWVPPVPVLNTGNPGEFSMLELADEVERQVREFRPGTGKFRREYRPLPGDDPKKRRPDITLARAFLGWRPQTPLREGLAKTVAYFASAAEARN